MPVLLFDGGCATCTVIGHWVQRRAVARGGDPSIVARPVGHDLAELRRFNPALDLWAAYAVVHVIMPDGSMKLGGAAVAEVFRCLPGTGFLARACDLEIAGVRPFQRLLDLAYQVLDDIRPLLGCESCGHPKPWVRPLQRVKAWAEGRRGAAPHATGPVHFRPLPKASSPPPRG